MSNKRNILLSALSITVVILLIFLVFSNTIAYDFLSSWDDPEYITENPHIRGITFNNIKAAFSKFYVGNYAPLHIISYMFDYEFWGLNPAGYRISNILMHALNSALCFFIARIITRNIFVSLSAALLFALHPVQSETVAWLSQRKTLLSMFFMLLSFYFYIRYSNNKKISLLSVSLVMFLLSLLSKAVTVLFPIILIAYEVVLKNNKRWKEYAGDIALFVFFSIAISIVTIKAQRFEFGGGLSEYHGGSFINNLFTMLSVTIDYLRLIFIPFKLSAVYEPHIYHSFWVPKVIAGAAVIIALLSLSGYLFLKRKAAVIWLLWIVVFILPVFQIIPIYTLINDRYLYVPIIGVTVLFCSLLERIPKKIFAYTIVISLTIVLSFLAHSRNMVWKNSYTLWTDSVEKTPNSGIAWNNLAGVYAQKGMNEEALKMFQNAVRLRPGEPKIHFNLGITYMDLGNYANAIIEFRKAIDLYKKYYDAWIALEEAYYKKGDTEASIETRRSIMGLKPEFSSVYTELGRLDLERGWLVEAEENLSKALSMNPEDADAYLYLSMVYAEKGDKTKAISNLRIALRSDYLDAKSLKDNNHFRSIKDDKEFREIVTDQK